MLQKIRFVFFFWQKRPKTMIIGIIVQDDKNSKNPPLFIWPSMWARLEHAYCLETINKMSEEKVSMRGRKRTLTDSERKEIATSAWVWTRSTSFSSFQRSNWSPTYILHLFHLEDTALLFPFLSESVKVRFLPGVDTFSSDILFIVSKLILRLLRYNQFANSFFPQLL
jgi:hypothetical protein